ncbi:helix-turn-helix domain-containing protein [Micromonospora sp. 4G55]|uniref:helix-turn-helix domain-containing protein n=1 Tax=Micromonospora sp. 4G55 TaxID=2806102 RepID=UPI001A4CBC37|nr:helix-turn-helix domain-containing protein [Micromonospora sp. 4G55]MBM0258506.1 MarR family transcriptional regulator [Micromonospora sp. 4G55]
MNETGPALSPSTAKVLAALAALGEATASGVAAHAEIGYSTTTPKLRSLEEAGLAERFRVESRTMWRLTDAGRATAASDSDTPPIEAEPANQTPAAAPSAAAGADPADISTDVPETGTEMAGIVEPPAGADGDAVTADSSCAGDLTGETSTPDVANPQELGNTDAVDTAAPQAPRSGNRRAGGSLRAVLDVLEAHPQRQFKTGELCRLIDAANDGSRAAKASAGAVANAAIKLVAAGLAVQTVDRPATFQLAPTDGQ